MGIVLAIVVRGAGLPALAAAVVHLGAARRLRAGGATWAATLALLAAYATGHVGLLGRPPFPPREAMHWTLYVAFVAAALAVLEVLTLRMQPAARWVLRALLVGAALRGLLDPLVENTWGGAGAWLRIAGLTLVALGAWFGSERALAARPGPPWAAWLALFLLAGGAAVSLAVTGTLSLGQLAGALAAGAATTLVASLLFRGPVFVPSCVPVPAWILTGLLLTGRFYSSLPTSSALLLAFAPVALLVLPAGERDERAGVGRTLVRTVPLLVPLGAAILLAVLSAPSSYDY